MLPHPALPHVLVCGYASRESYGAQSWLLLRPEGDVLVDVPRPAPALLDRIDGPGGVRHILRTHRVDVHEHEKIAARFGADRIMHEADTTATSCCSAATTLGGRSEGLGAGRSVCWYSWSEQTRSMEAHREHRFAHVLPGYGRPWHGGHAAREAAIDGLIDWMTS